ncbi:universal stress protein [Kribbella sp. NPDC020789]
MPARPLVGPGGGSTVVVGVDGSKASANAIDFAFGRAEAWHARLVVLHAWIAPFLVTPNGAPAIQFDEREITEDAQRMVSESVAGAAAEYPDVSWQTVLVSGSAAEWLVHLSESADLVVTGTRGHSDLTGLLLGSVTRHLLHHAHSPTAIVR